MKHTLQNQELMARCIEVAKENLGRGQYALGALVVDKKGIILSAQSSNLISGYDPTAHPEIVAIRESAEKNKSRYLEGCYLYTTLEPCPMCTAAAIWARMDGIVYGARQQDAIDYANTHKSNIFTWRQIEVPSILIAQRGIPRIEIIPDVLREKCVELFEMCFY